MSALTPAVHGTYSLSTGSLSVGANENVGYSGTGSFTQSGGTQSVAANFYLGYNSGASGTYSLSVNGDLAVAAIENIGYSGTGLFTQSGGTHTIGTYLYIGYEAGSSGTYRLSGGYLSVPSTNTNGNEYLGYSGTATFMQSGGTHTINSNLDLGYSAGGSGAYSLSGSGYLSAIQENVGWAGSGSFTQSGGTNSAGSLMLAQRAGSTGSYSLNGGLLRLTGLSQGAGNATFNFSGGTLQAAQTFLTSVPIVLTTAGSNGDFDNGGNTLALSGPLSGPGGLQATGTGTLTLAASNTYTGGTTISAGVLAAADSNALGRPLNLAGGTLRIIGAPSYSTPASIGIKFASGQDATTGLPASTNGINYGLASNSVAGIVQQANWNNVYHNAGSQGSLIDSSGTARRRGFLDAPSTFPFGFQAANNGATGLSAPTNPNDQLTNSYCRTTPRKRCGDGACTGLAPRAPAFPSVNVNLSGIPYASYGSIVYFDGAPSGEARKPGITLPIREATTPAA